MRHSKRFIWQYLPWILIVILGSLIALGWYAADTVKSLYLGRTAQDLEARSRLFARIILRDLEEFNTASIQNLCVETGSDMATRFTVILPSGEVLGDSEEDPKRMENHADRPEIIRAFDGSVGQAIRYSNTLKKEMMYMAVPWQQEGQTLVVIRSSVSVDGLSERLNSLYRRIALAGLVVAICAVAISLILSRRIQKPLHKLEEGAVRFGDGDLSHRVHISDPEEFMLLGNAMNQMAGQLNDRVHTITSQRNELESILSSMMESVLVIDADERVLKCNQSAGRLFGVDPEAAENISIQEVTRNIHLVKLIREILSTQRADETELILHEGSHDRFLQANGTVLFDYNRRMTGVLIVLNDITRLKRLENIRKDFVANVSHELKTPITAIQGSVETLADGAINQPEDARRFLAIIRKHVERLTILIEDLLNLSRIEQEVEKNQIPLEDGPILTILKEAVNLCQNYADEKSIQIKMTCSLDLTARINASLLEEAVINLLDNAIKYSNGESMVHVNARRLDESVHIAIEDTGCGIAPEHQKRIFERFYRVDKARSRNLGGTGLGLAIVKHIVQAHGGSIAVTSKPGEGSTFTMIIPIG